MMMCAFIPIHSVNFHFGQLLRECEVRAGQFTERPSRISPVANLIAVDFIAPSSGMGAKAPS
jgi:hypothetical protein